MLKRETYKQVGVFNKKNKDMGIHLIDMILSGLAYVILVYFMMRMLHKKTNTSKKDDEGDGGINIDVLPKIDLPPGVTWSGSPPSRTKDKSEVEEVCY